MAKLTDATIVCARRALMPPPPPASPRARAEESTIAAIATLDAQFPWLRSGEKRPRKHDDMDEAVMKAREAQGGHTSRHTEPKASSEAVADASLIH